METAEHKTVNSTLVNKNEVLTTLWKLSQGHAPSYIKQENTRINRSFYTRDQSWNFNTPERHLEH